MGTKIRTSLLATLVWAGAFALNPATASAVPKLDVKVFLGVGSTTFVPRLPTIVLDDAPIQLRSGSGKVPVSDSRLAQSLRHRTIPASRALDASQLVANFARCAPRRVYG